MRTFIPSIEWVYSPVIDKRRILEQLIITTSGFYQRKGMLILPKSISGIERFCIVIPEEVRNIDEADWKIIREKAKKIPINVEEDWLDRVCKKWKIQNIESEIVKEKINQWKLIEKKYWHNMYNFFGSGLKRIGKIETRITNYGSSASHYLTKGNFKQNFIINLRSDMGISEMAGIIINSLLYPSGSNIGWSFEQRLAIKDFLMNSTELHKIFPNYKSASETKSRITLKFRKYSEEYVDKIGLKIFNYQNYIFKDLLLDLGASESRVVQKLWEKKDNLVSFDEIADVLWGQGKFKSFWAINKIIQRIRKKFEVKGLDSQKIQTLRGRGYVWLD